MLRKPVLILVGLTILGAAAFVGNAMATPASGVTAETFRGELLEPIRMNTKFAPGTRARMFTKGDMETITQRIVATPGATFGWHTHPGINVNVVSQGALTLYHDETCTQGTTYGTGTSFTTSPDQVHLAKNLSTTDTLVLFATYLAPRTTPPLPVRIDVPVKPGPSCPE